MSNRNKCLFCFVFPNETASHFEKCFLSPAAVYEDEQGKLCIHGGHLENCSPSPRMLLVSGVLVKTGRHENLITIQISSEAQAVWN